MKNIGQMMKQAQQMQEKMAELQARLGEMEVDGQSGGGMVQATLSGKGELRRIKIDPSLAKSDEVEVLEDLVVAAVNDARQRADAMVAEEMSKLTGGLQLPPGMKQPFAEAMRAAAERIRACSICGNLDTDDPCALCRDQRRDPHLLCVVEDVADLWAIERTAAFRGRYHVLGGTLSALEGIGPEDLRIDALIARASDGEVRELILALNATVEGQTTAHYVMDRLAGTGVAV